MPAETAKAPKESGLENIAKSAAPAAPAEQKKCVFDTIGVSFKKSLDNLVEGAKNVPNALKDTAYTALYAGTLFGTFALSGFNPIAIGSISALSAGFMGGYALKQKFRTKEPISYRQLMKEGIKGALLGTVLYGFWDYIAAPLYSDLYKVAAMALPAGATAGVFYHNYLSPVKKKEKKEKAPAEKYSPEQLQQLAQQAGYKLSPA